MEKWEQDLLDACKCQSSNTDELTVCFRNAVKLEIVKKKLQGVPVARYDKERGQVYLEYADGRREYENAE